MLAFTATKGEVAQTPSFEHVGINNVSENNSKHRKKDVMLKVQRKSLMFKNQMQLQKTNSGTRMNIDNVL